MKFPLHSLKRILLTTSGFLASLWLIGFLLPSAWHVERELRIQAPPARIFPYLNNLRNWQAWTVWTRPDRKWTTEYSGPEAGVGATSRWYGEPGRGVLKIMLSENNRQVGYTLFFNGDAFRADGVLRLVPEGTATRVVWRAAGEVGRSSLDRYFALLLGHRIGADFSASLELLKQLLETRPANAIAPATP